MIQAYGTPEQLGEFSERMQAVQEEPASQQPSRRPLARDDASDEESRQELIRDYLELLHTLPNGGALQAADDFNRRYGSLSAAATERAQ